MLFSTEQRDYTCAIYTRISDLDISEISPTDTLKVQREICENYIKSQPGWKIYPTRYDDRSKSGGTLERPAFKQLIADAKAGKFNMIVVKSIDRFTRSLKDFYTVWTILLQYKVSLCSATQSFNTDDPAGRLHLQIILSFAQYERELASERTRMKMTYLAQKGLTTGGHQTLGFTPHPKEKGVMTIDRVKSARKRHPIPIEPDTPFRFKATGHSDRKRHLF